MVEALVLRRVHAFDPGASMDAVVDIVIERGVISRVGVNASVGMTASADVRIIDEPGLFAFPSFVDLHSHFREPGHEGKEDIASGLRAAAAGGFGDVCVMPNTSPVNDTRIITEGILALSRKVMGARLHPIGAITVGQKGEALTEMADLKEGGVVAVSDDGRCVQSSAVMRRALEYAVTVDLPLIQHAEDHALTEDAQMHEGAISTRLGLRGWPRVAEDIIVARDLILAEYTQSRYHLAHTSTMGAVHLLREAKSRGIRATAEVTPHHLLLTDAAVLGYNTACKVNPPLREEEDVAALREALADGTIDCIATDHAPHGLLDKKCEFTAARPGMVGLETCVPLLFALVTAGTISMSRFIDALTASPAKIVGIAPPTIREGSRADLTLFDPAARYVIDPNRFFSKSRNTPFAGREVLGQIRMTVLNGLCVFERGFSERGGANPSNHGEAT